MAQARLTETPIVAGREGSVPSDIQFMPPGRNTIAPRVNGKPLEMEIDVTPRYAQVFQAALSQLRAKATAGQGDLPFIDFNHEDGRSAGEAIEFYWGGDDPKTGGVRLKVAWTGSGKEAVTNKDFRRFSPQWIFHKDTKEPLGLEVNVGGLVNKAAFRSIQPIASAKALSVFDDAGVLNGEINRSEAIAQAAAAHPALYRKYRNVLFGFGQAGAGTNPQERIAEVAEDSLVQQAKQLAAQENISFAAAAEILAVQNPKLYAAYCRTVGKGKAQSVQPARLATASASVGSNLMSSANAIARGQSLAVGEAIERAVESNPGEYENYRRELLGI